MFLKIKDWFLSWSKWWALKNAYSNLSWVCYFDRLKQLWRVLKQKWHTVMNFLTVCKARILIWWNDINMKIMKPWWKDIKESAKLSGQIIKKESQQNLQLANHFVWFRPYKTKIDLGCLDFHNTSAPPPQMCAVSSKWRHSHRVFWLYLFKRHAREKKRERNKKKCS